MPRHKGSKDKTPRKSRSAPTSNGPVSTDHNLPAPAPLTDDQNAALLIQGVGKIEALLEKQAETTSSIRIIRKFPEGRGLRQACRGLRSVSA
jgi:hypothetical protein